MTRVRKHPGSKTPDTNKNADMKPIVFGEKDDYQLQQALNYLKGKPVVQNRKAAQTAKSAQ